MIVNTKQKARTPDAALSAIARGRGGALTTKNIERTACQCKNCAYEYGHDEPDATRICGRCGQLVCADCVYQCESCLKLCCCDCCDYHMCGDGVDRLLCHDCRGRL